MAHLMVCGEYPHQGIVGIEVFRLFSQQGISVHVVPFSG